VSAWGVGFGLIPVSVTAWIVEREIDAGQALLVVAFQVAISSGSLFGGVIADHFGIPDTLLCAALLPVVCAMPPWPSVR
jgi:predicted MFS family arabinose efflux permease